MIKIYIASPYRTGDAAINVRRQIYKHLCSKHNREILNSFRKEKLKKISSNFE